MVAQGVAIAGDAPQDLGAPGGADRVADHAERGDEAVGAEDVQQALGLPRVGAVVEGERGHQPRPPRDRERLGHRGHSDDGALDLVGSSHGSGRPFVWCTAGAGVMRRLADDGAAVNRYR